MSDLKKVSFRIDTGLYSQIEQLANSNAVSSSEMIRRLIHQSLDKEIAKDSVDFVRQQLREEMESYCSPQFERIAKLEAKIGYKSVSTFNMLVYALDSLLPFEKHQNSLELQRKAKAMAISYLKLSERELANILASEEKSKDKLEFD